LNVGELAGMGADKICFDCRFIAIDQQVLSSGRASNACWCMYRIICSAASRPSGRWSVSSMVATMSLAKWREMLARLMSAST
jgi:hypothetical protein